MKKIVFTVLFIFGSFQLIACAGKARVVRLEGGINKAEYVHANSQTSKNRATDGAIDFCKSENKQMIVVDEKTTFSGTFDEKTTRAIQTAGTVGQVLGSVEAGNAGWAATQDAEYTTVITFKCQ